MELLIMAAGMGSRFGGLKQVEPFGPNGEFILDYSIYDAIKVGCKKVVFIIKEENYELFKETIGARIAKHIEVEYVFQKLDNAPSFVKIPKDRQKPWGTAHAIYCAKDKITGNFAVINADDFYGYDAFRVAKEFIDAAAPNEYATIGYKVKNTMTDHGSVKRGILSIENGVLKNITESFIEKVGTQIIATPLGEEKGKEISEETLVTMGLMTFDVSIFPYLEKQMNHFFKENENDLETCEFLIGDVISAANKEGYAKMKVLHTDAVWYGVTYKEDKEYVKRAIQKLIEEKEYPRNLWR